MKVTCLVSGGKDSIFALWIALHQFNVTSIITVQPKCSESLLFHIPNSKYVVLIADMLNIPHKMIWTQKCDLKTEIKVLQDVLIETKAEALITGGLRSEFQRYKFNHAAKRAKMKCFNPLWRISPQILMQELLNNNFHIILVSVSSMGFSRELLGKRITKKLLMELQRTASTSETSITGEGGEYESFVLDAPFFPSRIEILESKIRWNIHREEGYFEIIKVRVHPK